MLEDKPSSEPLCNGQGFASLHQWAWKIPLEVQLQLHIQYSKRQWCSSCEDHPGGCGTSVHSQVFTAAPGSVLAKDWNS